MQDIGKSMGRGVAWNVAGRVVEKLLGLLSTFVLARWLLPEHFGVVMIASAIVAALELMGAFSFDTVLIQLQNATREHYDAVWTLGLLFNCFYALILIVGASPLASFYGEDRLIPALSVIAVTRLMAGLSNIGVIDFRKNLQFSQDFAYSIARKIMTIAVTMTSAYFLRDHRALLIGLMVGSTYGLVISYTRHPFRPKLSLQKSRDIFGSASWLFVHNIVYFINTRSAEFLVAKLAGTSGLGIFSLANEVASAPVTEIAAPVNRAAMPAFAKLQDRPQELVSIYRSTLAAMALVLLPTSMTLGTVAPLFVATILGERWSAVADLMPILALAALPLSLVNNNGVVLLALGDSKLNAILSAVRAATLLLSLLGLGMLYGVTGAAYAVLLTNSLFFPLSHWVLAKRIDIKASACALVCLRPGLAALPMGLLIHQLSTHLTPSIPALVGTLLAGALTYSAALLLLWLCAGRPASHEKTVLRWLRSLLPLRA